MRTIEIYRNYGVLGSEKRNIYTFGGEHPNAKCSDKMTVIVPDGWDVYENQVGKTMVSSPWGWDYEINEILKDKNGLPSFQALDKDMYPQFKYLYTTEEMMEKKKENKRE